MAAVQDLALENESGFGVHSAMSPTKTSTETSLLPEEALLSYARLTIRTGNEAKPILQPSEAPTHTSAPNGARLRCVERKLDPD